MRRYLGVGLMVASLLPVAAFVAMPAGSTTTGLAPKITGTAVWSPPAPKLASTQEDQVDGEGDRQGQWLQGHEGHHERHVHLRVEAQDSGQLHHPAELEDAVDRDDSIKWNNKKTSSSAKLTITPAGTATVKIAGKISGGTVFKGKSVSATVVFTPQNGGCTTRTSPRRRSRWKAEETEVRHQVAGSQVR